MTASAVILAAERITYIAVSCRPIAFARLVDRVRFLRSHQPEDVVAALFLGFKVVQVTVFASWFREGDVHLFDAPAASMLGVMLIAVGQWLNARVFLILGRVGAFYGAQFGRPVPWSTELPFSVLAHPQYVGAVMSIWGLFLLIRFPSPDWWVIPLLETLYYAAGARLECISSDADSPRAPAAVRYDSKSGASAVSHVRPSA